MRRMSQIGDTRTRDAIFHVRALAEIRGLPRDVRKRIGAAIWDLQLGRILRMPQSRPLSATQAGIHELRLHDESGQYRVFYCVRPERGVLILSAFMKRTRRTPMREVRLATHRLRNLLDDKE